MVYFYELPIGSGEWQERDNALKRSSRRARDSLLVVLLISLVGLSSFVEHGYYGGLLNSQPINSLRTYTLEEPKNVVQRNLNDFNLMRYIKE